jgi:MFS family permease
VSSPVRPRAAVAFVFFAHGSLFGTWFSRIPAIKDSLSLGEGELGLALFGATFGALASLPATGWLVPRVGSRSVVARGLPVFALLLVPPAFASGLATLTATLLAFGAAAGALDVAMNAHGLAVERRYGRPILSSFHAAWSFGGLAGAGAGSIAAWLALEPSVHFAIAAAVLGLPGLVLGRFLLAAAADRTAAPLLVGRPPRRLLALAVLAFCGLFGEGAAADWSAVYIAGPLDGGAAAAALGFAAFSVTMTVVRLAGDRLTVRWGPAALVRRGGAAGAGGLAVALVGDDPALALVGFAVMGAGLAALVPIAFRAAGSLPDIAPAAGLAALTTVGYAAFLVSPPVIGFAAEVVGLRAALWLVVALLGAVVVLAPAAGTFARADTPVIEPHMR